MLLYECASKHPDGTNSRRENGDASAGDHLAVREHCEGGSHALIFQAHSPRSKPVLWRKRMFLAGLEEPEMLKPKRHDLSPRHRDGRIVKALGTATAVPALF